MAKYKIENALLCDDVRREGNGKLILIGVYTGGIGFTSPLPVTKNSLKLYISGETDQVLAEIQYRVIFAKNKIEILAGKAGVKITGNGAKEAKPFNFSLPLSPIKFTETGLHKVQMKFDEDRWNSVLEFEVLPPK